MKMHGEIISWDVASKTEVPFTSLTAALEAAGFDPTAAREMTPRDAFSRAARRMADARIIRKVDETDAALRFQFTQEKKSENGERLDYYFEAVLALDKKSGKVACAERPELAEQAEKAIAWHASIRNNLDITRLIQKLFSANADLFPVRSQGGCYFVPATFRVFLEKVEKFVALIGASLRRFPVPAGYSPAADRSVSESVEEGLEAMVDAHVAAIDEFDGTTKDATLGKMVERINCTRFKAEAYAEFLGEKKAEIEAVLAEARATLRKKIASLGKTVEVPEPSSPVPLAPEAAPVATDPLGYPVGQDRLTAADWGADAERAARRAEFERSFDVVTDAA